MRVHHVTYKNGNPAFRAAFDAAFPGLPSGMSMEEAERRLTAALIAYDGARWSAQVDFEEAREVAELGKRLAERMGGPLAEGLRNLGRKSQSASEAFRQMGLQIEAAGK